MLKLLSAALGLAFVIAMPASAQQGIDPVLFEQERRPSIWDGLFTEAQAARGQVVYTGTCAFCHGRRLDGLVSKLRLGNA